MDIKQNKQIKGLWDITNLKTHELKQLQKLGVKGTIKRKNNKITLKQTFKQP